MSKPSIAIIDVIGLTYDATTVEKFGLGGSESAVIYMADELARLGFAVTVFNNCIDNRSAPGVYNGVVYKDLEQITPEDRADIVIASRSVIPFLPEQHWKDFNYTGERFVHLKRNAKLKVLWLHDTFCSGDHLLESMVVNGDIDEVFTLSDFHTTYFSFCHHGGDRRNPEVLKRKIFMTRNGIRRRIEEVDINAKDPNLFVYNASATKGMTPLVEDIWPRLKANLPMAKLVVIGGYYKFRDNAPPDAQQGTVERYSKDPKLAALGIEFTGIIPQQQIAEILAKSSFMLYPGAFPETFGISTLESLAYHTPLVTTRFGALEETALEQACYLMEYAIEPNSLYPSINRAQQIEKFVRLTLQAVQNTYLTAQKRQYCHIIREIEGWDSVALQWKQHFYRKLGLYLSVDDYRKVSRINQRVHQIFGRRFSNPEEWTGHVRQNSQEPIAVISPFYNAAPYIAKCIESVAAQDYKNYTHYLIDDASTDDGYAIAEATIAALPERIRDRFKLIRNTENVGAVANQVGTFNKLDKGVIVMLLDGDDSLVNNPEIFHMYNYHYKNGAEFTYGSSWSMVDNIPLIAQPYPKAVREAKKYREYRFAWNMPYTHLRTFKSDLAMGIPNSEYQDETGRWFRAGGDTAIFYNLIERANPDKILAIPDVVYNYNDINPLNDYKVNGEEQNRTAAKVLGKGRGPTVVTFDNGAYKVTRSSTTGKIVEEEARIKSTPVRATPKRLTAKYDITTEPIMPKKILIAVPTAKYIDSECFKSIYDLEVPEGYETELQFFFGYNIDQIRNLIAEWAKRYDYLFSVDSDIILPQDTLVKMLRHDKDMVSGVYLQERPGSYLEAYKPNATGGMTNLQWHEVARPDLYEVVGCGFGCVLVKSWVFQKMQYPHFVYHSALDHANTVSEDVDFCIKARNLGARIFLDSTILCGHVKKRVLRPTPLDAKILENQKIRDRLKALSEQDLLPRHHKAYLEVMKGWGKKPKVVYDIGACVLHWTNSAKTVWPDAEYIAFEAMDYCEFLYTESKMRYHMGVLTDVNGKKVTFYQNAEHPGGNSYYKENPAVNPEAPLYFNESHKVEKVGRTLDSVIAEKHLPLPDLIKMDVQGAELDILKGARRALSHCTDVILELQQVDYNEGAPKANEVIAFMESIGFTLKTPLFSKNRDIDGDYHFERVQ